MSFKKPSKETLERMTVKSIGLLVTALKRRRDMTVRPLDVEIQFYEKLLKQKEDAHAKTTSSV